MRYFILFVINVLCHFNAALADYPRPWQMGLQDAATPVMEKLTSLDMYQHGLIACIVIFVLGLLTYVCIRFNKKNNPVPSANSHNTTIEIIWTVIPVILIISILIPSLKLLYYIDRLPEAEMNIKVVGHQWYWEYQYPDHGGFSFDSMIVPEDKLQEGQMRLLTVDNHLVVPVDTTIRVLVTSADVIHSWGVPSFGVKTDAIPGKINENWIRVNAPGFYYGQCYELCGVNHGFMPIKIEAKSKEDFANWAEDAKTKFASFPQSNKSLIAYY